MQARARLISLLTLTLLLLFLSFLAMRQMHDSLWYDEWRSLFNTGAPEIGAFSPPQIWERIANDNAWQAPAYYTILDTWGAAAGWTEFATRMLSLLFGLAAVAWMYRLGADVHSRAVGLYAAGALGLCAFYLHFLHEMRAYTLVVLLTIVMLDTYWRLTYRRGGWGTAALFALSVAGLPYTHYYAVVPAFALALYHLLFVSKNRAWLRVPALMLLALLCFLPWLPVVLSAVGMAGDDARRFLVYNPGEFLAGMLTLAGNGSPALLVLLLAFSLLSRRRAAVFGWFMLVSAFILLNGLDNFVRILVEVKYGFPLFVPLLLLAALGVEALARRGLSPRAVGAVWLAAGLWSTVNPAYQEAVFPRLWTFPWREAAATVDGRAREGDAALILMPDPTLLEKNYTPLADHYFAGLPVDVGLVVSTEAMPDAVYESRALEAVEGAERVWLLYDGERRPWRAGPVGERVLPEAGYALCGEMPAVAPMRAALYARQPEGEPAALYDGLRAFNLGVSAPQSAVLPVVLGFESALPPDTYSFALHVYAANGTLVAQTDTPLPNTPFGCRALDVPLPALAPGRYTVNLIVYAWQTGERLRDANGADVVELGAFEAQ